MKYFFALSLLLCFMGASAQKIIEKPKFSAANTTILQVDKIELSDTATVIHFLSFFTPGNWIRIAKETYINAGNEKLIVKSASGLDLNEKYIMPPSGQSSFKLVFPPVSSAVKKIDFIESDCDNCFKIYDIAFEKQKSILPEALMGNWFPNNGERSDYPLGLYDSVMVWNNEVWKYTDVKTKGKTTTVNISNGKEKRTLYAKAYGSQYKIGTDARKLLSFSKTEDPYNPIPDTIGFIAPILKADSATYKGFIKGYSTKLGYKTGTIYVNNITTGSQENYLITINPNGTFYTHFPMYHPVEVFVRIPGYYASVFLEPGKELFHVIDLGARQKLSMFQGPLARINSELQQHDDLPIYDIEKLSKNILDVTSQQYKEQVLADRDNKLNRLRASNRKFNLDRKTYQLLEKDIIFGAARLLLRYNIYREDVYRKKNNTPNSQRTRAVEPVKLDSNYYDFAELALRDERAIASNNFGSFINSVRFLDDIMAFGNAGYSFKDIIAKLKTSNQLDPEDIAIADQISVIQKGTEADKDKLEVSIANRNLFITKYQDKINKIASSIFEARRRIKLKSMLNLEDDALLLDIITAQAVSDKLKRAFVPYTDHELNEVQNRVHSPFLRTAFLTLNNELKAKVDANRKKKGFVLNEVPKTAPDSLFAGMIKKYAGKAVYVDFWATWCGPCRSGIEQIAPLKEELQNENVVFLYITNPSSPLDTYNNMIPGIKGEHFRVSNDQWNLLSSRFKISGIPHYALVDKRGVVVNDHLPHLNNSDLKKQLMELVKE